MPVQWTSDDGRTIARNANRNDTLPASAEVIELTEEDFQEPDYCRDSDNFQESDDFQESDESQESGEALATSRRNREHRGAAKRKAKGKQVKGTRQQKYVSARQEIIKDHVKRCSNCKKYQTDCIPADPETHFVKCEPCVSDKRSDPPCDQKEWLEPMRVRKYFELRQDRGKGRLEAAAIIYGTFPFFGDAKFDKVPAERYMKLPSHFRKKYCRRELWDDPIVGATAATRQPPVDTQHAAWEATSSSPSRSHQPLPSAPQTPRNSLARASPQHQQAPQSPQQDYGANISARTYPSTPNPMRRGASSADNTPAPKRLRSWSDGSPEPDRRDPETVYAGRRPLLPPEQFTQAVSDIFTDFVTSNTAHLNADVASSDVREMALSMLRDALCNDLWRLLNFRGRSYTSVYGVFSEQRRGDLPPSSRAR